MKKCFYLMAAMLVAMVGCNKEPQVGGETTENGSIYMQFSVNMLTTRTGTDNNSGNTNSDASPDYEVGKDKENKISKVDIVLSKDGSYVVAKNVVPAAASTDTYVASFSTLELVAGAAYKVYVYANCEAPAEQNLDEISAATIEQIAGDNNFWMTNAYEAATTTLPTDLSLHTQPNNPLNLGSHYVERVMARFDYMPKGPYTIGNAEVTLTQAALINQSKNFYMFRRVSTNGTDNNWTVGGVETPVNYVVDTDFAAKANGWDDGLAGNFDAHMTLPTTWTWKSIAAADLKEADNWKGTNDGTDDPLAGENGTEESTPEHNLNEYYIWQYAKENTIPNVDAQDNGITTGVVFKGEITGPAVTAANKKTIYVFENVLYGNWEAVLTAAAAADAPATLVAAVNKVKAVATPTATDYANAGFTGYSPDAEGNYYAYYYYWNRHNDNGKNTVMGPMEFAVVRNNVYKLCVDKIARFGHPTPGGNDPDPDPVDPNDPDESLNYYFTVTVKVLPWVVRVNHIEF